MVDAFGTKQRAGTSGQKEVDLYACENGDAIDVAKHTDTTTSGKVVPRDAISCAMCGGRMVRIKGRLGWVWPSGGETIRGGGA